MVIVPVRYVDELAYIGTKVGFQHDRMSATIADVFAKYEIAIDQISDEPLDGRRAVVPSQANDEEVVVNAIKRAFRILHMTSTNDRQCTTLFEIRRSIEVVEPLILHVPKQIDVGRLREVRVVVHAHQILVATLQHGRMMENIVGPEPAHQSVSDGFVCVRFARGLHRSGEVDKREGDVQETRMASGAVDYSLSHVRGEVLIVEDEQRIGCVRCDGVEECNGVNHVHDQRDRSVGATNERDDDTARFAQLSV